jgi:hypothetical protein
MKLASEKSLKVGGQRGAAMAIGPLCVSLDTIVSFDRDRRDMRGAAAARYELVN